MVRIAIVAVIGLWTVTALPAQQDRRFGADLKDVNLHDLTVAVQHITKKTFLWTDELGLRNKRVHFISDKPIGDNAEVLFAAYQSILQVAQFVLVPTGEPGQEIYKITAAATANKTAVPFQRESGKLQDQFVTRVFSLKYVNPRDVQVSLINLASYPQGILTIESAGLLLVTDYDYNIKRFEEIIKEMDKEKPDIEIKTIQLKNAVATDIEQMMNSLVQTLVTRSTTRAPQGGAGVPGIPGQEAVKVVADRRTNAVILLAEPNRLPQLEEIVRSLDSETPFETSGIYFSHLRHTNAVDISRTLNAMYRIAVDDRGVPSGGGGIRPGDTVGPPGTGGPVGGTGGPTPYSGGGGGGSSGARGNEPTIVADIRSNSVIVITDRNTYKTLERIILRLDQRQPQVLIKATVVEFRTTDRFDLGFELARLEDPSGRTVLGGRTNMGLSTITQNSANNSFSIIPVDTPGVSLLLLRDRIGNIPAMLKALEAKAHVSILDEPEAATNNNGMAEMKVSNQVPVLQTTVTGTGVAQTTFNRFETAETTLKISPHISEGGYLRLETSVKIEKFTRESADATIPPPKTSREIITKEIMVPNATTMVIGGIVTQDDSDSVQGVPFISSIPLLGLLFQRTQKTQDKRTLYIFITPYILYDYSFGDYRDLTRERKDDMEHLRGEDLRKLTVDLKSNRLPLSTFQFQEPRAVRKEDE